MENKNTNIQDNTNETEKVSNNNTEKPSKKRKAKLKLTDDMILNVESTTFGTTVYVNKKTGDKVRWQGEKDVQQMSVQSIRAMKSNQIDFFEKNWIRIISIADDGYDAYTPEDIYKALMLQKYIENSKLDIEDLILNNPDMITSYVDKMGDTFKKSLIVRCNDMIKSQKLDKYSLIRKLEKILDCELRDLDED